MCVRYVHAKRDPNLGIPIYATAWKSEKGIA